LFINLNCLELSIALAFHGHTADTEVQLSQVESKVLCLLSRVPETLSSYHI
jgi:hypothetical protein